MILPGKGAGLALTLLPRQLPPSRTTIGAPLPFTDCEKLPARSSAVGISTLSALACGVNCLYHSSFQKKKSLVLDRLNNLGTKIGPLASTP